jgi:hypothetical protein
LSQALTLDGNNAFDDDLFVKIMNTCVTISNIGKKKRWYVLIGIVDSDYTAARIEILFSVRCITHDIVRIFGIEHKSIDFLQNTRAII